MNQRDRNRLKALFKGQLNSKIESVGKEFLDRDLVVSKAQLLVAVGASLQRHILIIVEAPELFNYPGAELWQ